MTARILLLGAAAAVALAACAPQSELKVPEQVKVEVPIACIRPADVPQPPALRTEPELMAMDRYRRTLATWSDLVQLQAYRKQLEAIAAGCSKIPARPP